MFSMINHRVSDYQLQTLKSQGIQAEKSQRLVLIISQYSKFYYSLIRNPYNLLFQMGMITNTFQLRKRPNTNQES